MQRVAKRVFKRTEVRFVTGLVGAPIQNRLANSCCSGIAPSEKECRFSSLDTNEQDDEKTAKFDIVGFIIFYILGLLEYITTQSIGCTGVEW